MANPVIKKSDLDLAFSRAKSDVPTKVSDLVNDLGFEANVQADWNVTSSSSDAYIKNKPTVPTRTSQLTNDSGYVADATYVHTDENYTEAEKNKLAGIAANAEVNVQADWNVTDTSSDAYIRHKPTIPAGVQITDRVDLTSSTVAASATAVKTVNTSMMENRDRIDCVCFARRRIDYFTDGHIVLHASDLATDGVRPVGILFTLMDGPTNITFKYDEPNSTSSDYHIYAWKADTGALYTGNLRYFCVVYTSSFEGTLF